MTEFDQKALSLKQFFATAGSKEEFYNKIMDLGQKLPPLPDDLKTPLNRVSGCQSTLYLVCRSNGPFLFFEAASDSLFSAGLAALLIRVYNGESAAFILSHSPTFLKDLGLIGSLSPSRSNGLAQIHRRMKQEALKISLSLSVKSLD